MKLRTFDQSLFLIFRKFIIRSTDNPESEPAKKLTCADLPKSEKPSLTAFLVSPCPYGIQMQRAFKKAIEQIPQLLSYLTVKYIGAVDNNKITSMHGDKGAQENLAISFSKEDVASGSNTSSGCGN